MLEVSALNVWYDRSHVVQDVSFRVGRGEIVTLTGRNGAGKTTTLLALMGLVSKRAGGAVFDGVEMPVGPAPCTLSSWSRVRAGGAAHRAGLTVRETLQLGLAASDRRNEADLMIDEIAQTFPRPKARLDQDGTSLSCEEQQMLAIARAMMARPEMILLDEPSEGIMPILVDELFELFARMERDGTTILLVEHNVERALPISDRAYIVDEGRIVPEGTGAALLADRDIQERDCAV